MPPGDPQPPYLLDGTFIVLSVDEANQVRGLTVPGHACAPVPLKDGTLILPIAVASDPHHAVHHDLLNSLPQRSDVMSDEMATGEEYPDEVQACTYDSETWKAGEVVAVEMPMLQEASKSFVRSKPALPEA